MNSFDDEFRNHIIRVSVQPGITGMRQVSSRSNGDLQVQKAQDLFYIRTWSIRLDIYMALQTVIVVLNGRGVNRIRFPEPQSGGRRHPNSNSTAEPAILSPSLSTQVTWWPKPAKQVPDTNPT
jgi:hypothetical protein